MFDVYSLFLYLFCDSVLHFQYSKITRVSLNVMDVDQALKACFEQVILPSCNERNIEQPRLPKLYEELIAIGRKVVAWRGGLLV